MAFGGVAPVRRLLLVLRTSSITIVVWALAVAGAHADGDESLLPPDLGRINERGQLIVAMVASDRFPFFFVDQDGQLAGIDVDMAKTIAGYLGVDVIFNRNAPSFDDVVGLIARGEADVAITKLSVTLPRAEQLLYTTPYVSLQQGVLVNRVRLAETGRQAEPLIQVMNDPATTLGVLKASSYVEFARRLLPKATPVEYDPKEALFQAVYDGEITAILYDENEIKQYIYESPDRLIHLQLALIPGAFDHIAMAVSWRDPHLHYWLNQVIAHDQLHFNVDELIARYQR